MELELKKEQLDAFETGGEVTLTQEETTETIVPDYCPDIARIIETEGSVFLHSRELRDGRAEVSGTVRVTVLCTPDGESGIRTLEFSIPFVSESEAQALPECSHMCVEAEPELLEARMLNPRKILTHCRIVTRIVGYRRISAEICEDVETEGRFCIEKRTEQQNAILLTLLKEKDFTFSDEITLPMGRDLPQELLLGRAEGVVTESRVVGNKLLFKGNFAVQLLYRTEAGQYGSVAEELPFSQIMEAEGSAEGADAAVQIALTGTDFQLDTGSGEGRVAVTLYYHAAAQVYEARTLTMLGDLYSTAYDLTYDAAPMALTVLHQRFIRRQSVREVLEIGVIAERILCVCVRCGGVSLSREGDSGVLHTMAAVRVLYQDEGGAVLIAERCMDVSLQVETPENGRVSACACCCEEPQGTIADRGIEVRFSVDFRVEVSEKANRICIRGARLQQESPRDLSSLPSLTLRHLAAAETLWDLAKRHHTTTAAILSANQLESEDDLRSDVLLLIPKKRT